VRVLVFVGSTLGVKFRSGIHRLVVEVARNLANVAETDLVKWDPIDGQLRYIDTADLAHLFGPAQTSIKPNRLAHRAQYRFGDTVVRPEETWLLYPEISHHQEHGNEILARIISQAREYGFRTAAIFYDIIPITNSVYHGARRQHISYVANLLRGDLIIPISVTSANVLEHYYKTELGQATSAALASSAKIVPVLLPEINSETPPLPSLDDEGKRDIIIMVGTVEPRKRQIEVLKAITQLQTSGAISARTETHVYGSLHPFVSDQFLGILHANHQVKYFNYAETDAIEASYKRAMFSIFASNDEGYGLPIAESLARGVPCVTANFGAMAEVAAGGGCLTCDVNDPQALTDAIRALHEDRAMRRKLRFELSNRRFRDWRHYCQDVVNLLTSHDEPLMEAGRVLEASLWTALSSIGPIELMGAGCKVMGLDGGRDARLVLVDTVGAISATGCSRRRYSIFRFSGDVHSAVNLDAETAKCAFVADLWGIRDAETTEKLIDRAHDLDFAGLLPGQVLEDSCQTSLDAALASRAAKAVMKERHRKQIAANERLFRGALRHWNADLPPEEHLLAVVLSTFNRAAFIEANVAWLIKAANANGSVRIVVVDNASTDDTVARLSKFQAEACFSLVINSQNTGMLGNLHVCSTLFTARHVWVTGDDDFILPQQLRAVLELLRGDPGLPLACVNFAVYHRERLRLLDDVRTLIAEGNEIAGEKLESGTYPVNVVAIQHDNLFTAIYPIVFRSDLFAACFNYPFDGEPFETLTECVPTTKWFLENYRYTDCYWHAPISIVGNAHNSWSRHRPRWHAVLMPQVFELARDAGADSAALYRFARLHIDLYNEAVEIARRKREPLSISSADLAPARRVFRCETVVPKIDKDP
jgi:glycosyltransferase involved in cell wall biosynthesis